MNSLDSYRAIIQGVDGINYCLKVICCLLISELTVYKIINWILLHFQNTEENTKCNVQIKPNMTKAFFLLAWRNTFIML